MSDSRVPRQLLAPRYWLAWLAAGVWFLLAQLPYRFQWWLARVLAPLLKLNKKRFGYAKRNLELCFPELSEAEREQLLKGNMESTAMALFETGIAWFWPKWRLRRLSPLKGWRIWTRPRRAGRAPCC